ncbi:MAG: hypothetical protein IPG92_08590 [Flavobacteriales bacterium]|nr:hypothetical protein [Flavobacteriales bacterium]
MLSAILLASATCAQLTFCSPQGNVALFSNYDGGPLTINVDQNIPDLHIGIVSYEFAVVNIVGPYADNVAAVWWAGFNGVNDHCGTGAINHATSISGAPAGTAEILVHPPATLSNTNGNALIICNYSCDIGSVQGGCNTADQIAHFFLSQWGGVLLFHRTQYGCWEDVWNISDGGNCCEDPLSTAMGELQPQAALGVSIVHGMLRVVTAESGGDPGPDGPVGTFHSGIAAWLAGTELGWYAQWHLHRACTERRVVALSWASSGARPDPA